MSAVRSLAVAAMLFVAGCTTQQGPPKTSVAANLLVDGQKAYEAGDYPKAHRIFEPLAYSGSGEAQVMMGRLYANGFDVPRDRQTAQIWYRRAAAGNDPGVLNSLGFGYDHALGADQDYNEAKKLYERASALGNLAATNSLGLLYMEGHGVPQDYAEAKRLFELAAAKNYAPSQINLGKLYQKGLGVPENIDDAVKWYSMAADQEDPNAMTSLGGLFAEGHGVKQDLVQACVWFSLAVTKFPSKDPRRAEAEKARDLAATAFTEEEKNEAKRRIDGWKSKPVNVEPAKAEPEKFDPARADPVQNLGS